MKNTEIIQAYRNARKEHDKYRKIWDDCQKYTLQNIHSKNQIFDSTAQDSTETLVGHIFNVFTPSSQRYIHIEGKDNETETLRRDLVNSNFYTEIQTAYLDLVINGTACLFMSETPIGSNSAFHFRNIPISQILIHRDSRGTIDQVFHTEKIYIQDILKKYPSWLDGAWTREELKKEPNRKLRIVQSVIQDDNGYKFTAWIDWGNDIEKNIVATGRFANNPYLIFRWNAAPAETYGRSPIMRALPDIKTANKVMELILKNATIAVSGIWQADDDGVINLSNINLTPGAIIPKAVGSSGLTPLCSGRDFDVSQLVLADIRQRIRGCLLTDKIIIPNEATATEILQKQTEKESYLTTARQRVAHELVIPMAERGLSILMRRGVIETVDTSQIQYIPPYKT